MDRFGNGILTSVTTTSLFFDTTFRYLFKRYNDEVVNMQGPIEVDLTKVREMVMVFKALADESRLRVIEILMNQTQLCVSDIANELGLTTSSVSHHLGLLTKLGFVTYERDGKYIYYRLSDECIKDIIQRVSDHVRGS